MGLRAWISGARAGKGGSKPSAPPPLPGPFHALSPFAVRPTPISGDTTPVAGRNSRRGAGRAAQSNSLISLVIRFWRYLSWKGRLIVAVPLFGAVGALSTLAVMMVYYTISFPHPLSMRNKERAPVIRILARDGSVLAERGAAHDYMPLDLLPPHVTGAVVATEDRRFFDHGGLDPVGLIRAVFANLRAGRFAQGGSTLTQQLAKNLFLTSERTLSRKVEELALALWLELRLAKTDILELYLNRVYFGGGAYGIEAASQRYFDKSAREVTLAEAAILAGLLKAPSKYSPAASPAAARARSRVVLSKMVEAGVISRADEAKARAEHVVFSDRKSGKTSSGIEYAVDFVLERLPPLVGAGHAEVIVETTLDAALQKRAGDIVSAALERQGKALSARQAAVIVIDTDGGIRALVGGRDYAASQFNRAVKARRQPGSAFKPFVYLAALESGVTPDTVTYDLPLSIDGWSPRNDSGQYVGEITVRKAIANSVNTVAVRLHQSIGRGRTADVARRLGIRSELRDGPSLALGTSEVSLMELTGAYGVLGNGGALIEPHAIRRVRMSSGRVLFAREAPRTTQIVDAQNVAEMNDLLNGAVMTGTGRRAALPGHPVAGKTGTTQEFRDALFVGYTAHLTAGVWIGNDDGRPMNRATGGGLPAEIWRDIMVSAHAGKAPLALPGTILRSRELPWAPVAASSPPRSHATDAERRRANEFLPWEKLNTGKPVSAVHPSERIGDDFIAKALAGVDGNEIAADGLADAGPSSASAETPRVERPRGMMSLGGWW